jgi:hypothetical protein
VMAGLATANATSRPFMSIYASLPIIREQRSIQSSVYCVQMATRFCPASLALIACFGGAVGRVAGCWVWVAALQFGLWHRALGCFQGYAVPA